MNQSEFLAITCNLIKAREKSVRLVLVLLLIGSQTDLWGLEWNQGRVSNFVQKISYNRHCRYPASNETPPKLVIWALLKDFLKKKSQKDGELNLDAEKTLGGEQCVERYISELKRGTLHILHL